MNKYISAILTALVLFPTLTFAQTPPPITITTDTLPAGVTGTPVSETLQASGGVPPFTWSATNLPGGISIDQSTGVISGTPTLPQGWSLPLSSDFSFTAKVQDSVGQIATATIGWTVTSNLFYARTPSVNGFAPYNTVARIQGIYGVDICPNLGSTYRISYRSGVWQNQTLVSGSASYGQVIDHVITLNPGRYDRFYIGCLNSGGGITSEELEDGFTVSSLPLITTNPLLPTATVNQTYSAALSYELTPQDGGNGLGPTLAPPYTWNVVNGILPTGLALDSATGVISGIPTVPVNSIMTIEVQDTVGQTDSRQFTLNVLDGQPPLTIDTSSLPNSTTGVPISETLQASGGIPPYTWSSTNLPDGLSIDPLSGVISGSPTLPQSWSLPLSSDFSFGARVQDSAGQVATTTIAWNVASNLVYTRTPSVNGYAPNNTTAHIHGIYGVDICPNLGSTYKIFYRSGVWQNQVLLSGSGSYGQVIDIDMTFDPGRYDRFYIGCLNSGGGITSEDLDNFTISSLPVVTTNSLLPVGIVSQPYSTTLTYDLATSQGGNGLGPTSAPPYTWSVMSGALPEGLTLDSVSGIIAGIPTTAQTVVVTIQVSDTVGQTDSRQFTLNVTEPSPLLVVTTVFPDTITDTPVSETLQVSGGVPPYIWSSANLPGGLSLDPSTGAVSGAPTLPSEWSLPVSSDFSFVAQVQDSLGQIATTTIAWNVTSNLIYTRTPSVNGFAPYGTVAQIHGVYGVDICPNLGGAYRIFYRSGVWQNQTLISGSGSYGQVIDHAITLNPGRYDRFYIGCVNLGGGITSEELEDNFAVASLPLISSSPLLQPGIVGQSYSPVTLSFVLTPQDGGNGLGPTFASPYAWSITAGALPDGINLDSVTGAISGMPTVANYPTASTFTVQIQDVAGQTDSKVFTMYTFNPLGITTTSLPNGLVGHAYSQAIDADNAVAPTSWSISSGALPEGLSVDSANGVISGTPTSGGVFNFTVRVVDANSQVATQALSIEVENNHAPVLASIGNKIVSEGELLQFMISATDPDNDTLAYSASNLPSGASFDPQTRTFTWTPSFSQEGNYDNVEFTVTDNGSPIELDVELITITVGNVNRAPVFDVTGSQQVLENEPLSFTVTATDPDTDAVTLSAVNAPSGATFDSQTGTFSWAPTLSQAGNYVVTFNATDNGTPMETGTTDVVITVGDNPTPTEQAQNLVDVVTNYDFPTAVENSYLANLKKVEKFIEEGKIEPAINQLNAVITKVDDDYVNGIITQSEHDNLIQLANALLDDLQ